MERRNAINNSTSINPFTKPVGGIMQTIDQAVDIYQSLLDIVTK